ncbi:phage regulatory CII family protein [Pseudodesulfovibrio tunisiensis]|uniref:phage regulatory CII family protein n=1 Tax=Pseudodesulfovibrio tunisiensis TaxID=463192 RepID=UPI001FB34AF4|nr:phage regulatory CII family protein [Pseudodesulfovibrio tunisiensis]
MFEKSVTKVVQDCILDSGIQAKHVAEQINKPYSTLMREINPFDTSAKLGAETLLDIMKVTNDIRPLLFMAEEMGYTLHSNELAEAV